MGSESGWPSIKRIADMTGLRKETVLDAVRRLVANGHFEIAPGQPGRGRSHYYTPILKGPETGPIEEAKKVRKADLSATCDVTDKRSGFSSEKVRFSETKGSVFRRKGPETGPEHFKEHLHRTPSLNTVRPSAAPADEEIQQAKKQVEQDLTDWKAKGLIDEQMADKTRSVITELLDGYASGEATREEVDAIYGKICNAVLKRQPNEHQPSGGSADCSAEVSEPIVLPIAAMPPEMPAVPATNVITIAAPPTVPTPSRPRRPKVSLAEQQNRDIRKSAVWRDLAEGRLDEVRAEQAIAAIDGEPFGNAAPPEDCAPERLAPSRNGGERPMKRFTSGYHRNKTRRSFDA
jgi:hypothetical protein